MAEAMCRIYEFEPLWAESSIQVLFAEAIDTVASKRGITLIDEQVLFAERVGRSTIFFNIRFNEPGGLDPQLHLPVLVALPEDRQGLVLTCGHTVFGVEVDPSLCFAEGQGTGTGAGAGAGTGTGTGTGTGGEMVSKHRSCYDWRQQ